MRQHYELLFELQKSTQANLAKTKRYGLSASGRFLNETPIKRINSFKKI